MVEISQERYDQLIRDQKELDALHAGGVDSWEWYHESLEDAGLLEDDDEDEEDDD
jgi:hypothetical protein